MDFSRLFLLFRLPLVVLVCSLLFGFLGNFSPDDSLAFYVEAAETIEESDDKKSFGGILSIVIFEDALMQPSNWVSLELGYAFKAASELHATGPPYV